MKNPERALLPFGAPLGGEQGCMLGPLSIERLTSRRMRSVTCGKPTYRVIAGVNVCLRCSRRLDAIVVDAALNASTGKGRKPETRRLLRVA